MSALYQYEYISIHALVQQLATSLMPNGYWFYKTGYIPEGKSPHAIDQKILDKYGIAISRSARTRRKAAGLANLHYLRIQGERTFVIVATKGLHRFRDEESEIRDIRKYPLILYGYSLSFKEGGYLRKASKDAEAVPDAGWHSRVQISRSRFKDLKAEFLDMALRYSAERLGDRFFRIGFEPYAPVRQQLLDLLRLVNAKRKTAGMNLLPPTVIRYQRTIFKPFVSATDSQAA